MLEIGSCTTSNVLAQEVWCRFLSNSAVLANLPLFKEAGIDLNAVRSLSLSSSAASAASPSSMPSDFDIFFWRSFEIDHILLVRFSGDNSTNRKELASLLGQHRLYRTYQQQSTQYTGQLGTAAGGRRRRIAK